MNPILIIRAEIICLIILLFITLFSRFYEMGKDQGNFLRICVFAIGHVLFDLITVFTVNNPDLIHPFINWICHIIFYMFALLFSYEFFCYTVHICYEKKVLKLMRKIGLIPLALYLISAPFLPMEYLQGNGTKYSFGLAAIVGYGVAMLLFISSIAIVSINFKKLDRYIRLSLFPMLWAAIIVEVIQILIPEMLFTGGTITLLTVGFFFSLENPVAVLRKKVLTDALTGVESRHSYESDIIEMDKKFKNGENFGIVFFDINDLKAVNDTRGHMAGDEYIGCVAKILMQSLKTSEKIYRMGGDEFLAVYYNKPINDINNELESVEAACIEYSKTSDYNISIAIGCAVSNSQYKSLRDVLRMADFRMYANKTELKQKRSYLLNNASTLNISGLTDRIFDAFTITDSNRFLHVTNLSTKVTRFSLPAAEYLGLNSAFIFNCKDILVPKIHPEDRKSFTDDLNTIITMKQAYYNGEYRIMNANDEYVGCSCSGTLLKGKSGDPDLFAGTIIIYDGSEGIDRLTGLRNGREFAVHLNHLIHSNTSCVIIKLSINNLSRINMLYGFLSGNDVLIQFSEILRTLIANKGNVFCTEGTKFVITLPGFSKQETFELYKRIRHAAEQEIYLDTIAPPLNLVAGAYKLNSDFEGSPSFIQSNLIFAYDKSRYTEYGNLIFYDDDSGVFLDSKHKNQLLNIHQDAIGNRDGFYLVYQPITSSENNRIIGAEALLRWRGLILGEISPNSFIPWLESDPCFLGLGYWIITSALEESAKMLSIIPDFVININITMLQMENDEFATKLLDILAKTGFPASQVCLELTERCREIKSDLLKTKVDFFRNNGIKVALDDLGTGFSSFGLLLSLQIDEIKLDQSFVKEIISNEKNQILTKLLIDASKELGYTTCLEGVEDIDLFNYLSSYGASFYQGYYCQKPLPIDEFKAFTIQWNENK